MKVGVSYFGNRINKHVRKDMRELKENGFTFVLHTYSEFDLMFRSETMKNIISTTHDEGLEVIVNPWGVGNVFGGEPFSNFVSQNIFNSCQILDDGNPTAIACPNSPKFNNYMNEWIDAVVNSGADYILWDEPHFHEQGFLSSVEGRWGCRCRFCKEKFFIENQKEMPIYENEEVIHFKKKCIFEFVKRLSERTKNSGLKNIIYLTADIDSLEIEKKWKKYFELDSIDFIASGPYWQWANEDISKVRTYAETLGMLSEKYNKEVQIWIQGFKIIRGREHEISDAIKFVCEAGIKNIAIWGYEGVAHESWVASENPSLVWEKIISSIQKFRK